jgi:hypothetical protein
LQVELNERRSQVDEVRDSAINLMSKSDRYNKMVEPELTHLNQQWEEVTARVKVKQVTAPPPHSEMVVEVSAAAAVAMATRAPAATVVVKGPDYQEDYEWAKNALMDYENRVLHKGVIQVDDVTESPEDTAKVGLSFMLKSIS